MAVMLSKALYVEYLRGFAREAKAIVLAESIEDPYALSPGALSAGIMQQSLTWQETYPPLREALANSYLFNWAMAVDRTHPFRQLACYATFVYRRGLLSMDARLREYHYGHEEAEDPDGYVDKVIREWNELAGW